MARRGLHGAHPEKGGRLEGGEKSEKRMKKKVGTPPTLGGIFALGGLLAHAGIAYRNTRQLVVSEDWVTHTQVARATIGDVQARASDAVAAQRGYLLSADPHFLKPFEVARGSIAEHLRLLTELTADNPAQQG